MNEPDASAESIQRDFDARIARLQQQLADDARHSQPSHRFAERRGSVAMAWATLLALPFLLGAVFGAIHFAGGYEYLVLFLLFVPKLLVVVLALADLAFIAAAWRSAAFGGRAALTIYVLVVLSFACIFLPARYGPGP